MRSLVGTSQGKATIIFAIAALLFVGWIIWARTHTVGATTVRGLEDLMSGRFEAVGRFALPEEAKDGDPTKQLKIIWENVVFPSIARATPEGEVSLEGNADPHNALAIQHYKFPNGAAGGLALQLSTTEDGPKGPLLQPLLYQAWYNRYSSKPGYKKAPGDVSAAVRQGLAEDSVRLRQLGINGVYVDRANRYMTWQELSEYLDAKVVKNQTPSESSSR